MTFVRSSFRELTQILKDENVKKVDGIYYDLGVSNPQLDIPRTRDSVITMSTILDIHGPNTELTAYEIVNNWSYRPVSEDFIAMARRNFSKQMARRIRSTSRTTIITTTLGWLTL